MAHKPSDHETQHAFTDGSSGATADMAADKGGAIKEHRHIDTPASRPVEPLKDGEKPDHMAQRESETEDRQEALLDEAIEETFPGSDPISPKHIT